MSFDAVDAITPDISHMKAIDWLWPGFLARGHFHVLAGSPGVGKSQIAISLAAILSQEGRTFPCGLTNPKGSVTAMWSGEDNYNDTIVPRLIASKCNLSNFLYLPTVTKADGKKVAFDPAIHMDALKIRFAALDNQVSLLVIDPIVSMITGDGNSNPQVRANLNPLVEFAARFNVAILGIHHFTKGSEGKPLHERVSGSIGLTALARIVMVAGRDLRENAPTKCVFGKAKANIASDDEGFGFNTKLIPVSNGEVSTEASIISWHGELDTTPSEALGSSKPNHIAQSLSKIQQAMDLILDTLKIEPTNWQGLVSLCEEHKISSRTAREARDRLKKDGDIELEYSNQWGPSPKWRLKKRNYTGLTYPPTPDNPDKPDKPDTSVNLLNNIYNNIYNTTTKNNNIYNKLVRVDRNDRVAEGGNPYGKSASGLIYNEGFEGYDVLVDEGETTQ